MPFCDHLSHKLSTLKHSNWHMQHTVGHNHKGLGAVGTMTQLLQGFLKYNMRGFVHIREKG